MLTRFLEQAFYDAVMNSAVKGGWNGVPIQPYVERLSWIYLEQGS
jgi:hypothetical protein